MRAASAWVARLGLLGVSICLIGLVSAPSAGAYIYWGSERPSETIGRANSDGTQKDTAFIASPTGVGTIAVTGTHLYWNRTRLEDSTIARADLDGENVVTRFLKPPRDPQWSVASVAVDDRYVYWSTHYGGRFVIGRARLDGSGVDPDFIILPFDNYTFSIASSGEHIYWMVPAFDEEATIARANADGGNVDSDFITGFGIPSAGGQLVINVAVENDKLYWCRSGGIGSADLDGTNIDRELVKTGCWGLAVDAGHAYWGHFIGDDSQVSIGRARLDGSRVEPRFVAGASHTDLTGLAVNTPELTLEVDPKRQRARRGRASKATVSVANTGDATLEDLEVSTELRMKKPHPKRARRRVEVPSGWKLDSLAPGETEAKQVRIGFSPRAFRGRYKLAFAASAADVESNLDRAKLKIRFKRR